MLHVNYSVGDFVTFWLWASRNRGRVIDRQYDYNKKAYMLSITRVSRYCSRKKVWEDLAQPYDVTVPESRVRSRVRGRSTVIYKLKGF